MPEPTSIGGRGISFRPS